MKTLKKIDIQDMNLKAYVMGELVHTYAYLSRVFEVYRYTETPNGFDYHLKDYITGEKMGQWDFSQIHPVKKSEYPEYFL